MNPRPTAAIVLIASLAVAPAAGPVGRAHAAAGAHAHAGTGAHAGKGHLPFGGQIFVNRPAAGHNHFTPRHSARHFGHRSVAVGVLAPAVIYAAPYAYGADYPYAAAAPSYESPDVYDPGQYYGSVYPQASGTLAAAPSPAPAPPMPTVVQYATGRYELRGDGTMTAYTWVWIPNPPSMPPPAAAAAAPPASRDSGVRVSTLYHWTDEDGVVHWTDRLQAVPERYREEAKSPAR